MISTLEGLGYNVQYKLLLAQYFNVPQKRERVFIVATRKDLPNNYKYPKELDYFVPLGVALEDCPASEGQQYPKRKKRNNEYGSTGWLLERFACRDSKRIHEGKLLSWEGVRPEQQEDYR